LGKTIESATRRTSLGKGEKVGAKIVGPTPLGYNVIVNGETEGLVYHSDVFDDEPLTPVSIPHRSFSTKKPLIIGLFCRK